MESEPMNISNSSESSSSDSEGVVTALDKLEVAKRKDEQDDETKSELSEKRVSSVTLKAESDDEVMPETSTTDENIDTHKTVVPIDAVVKIAYKSENSGKSEEFADEHGGAKPKQAIKYLRSSSQGANEDNSKECAEFETKSDVDKNDLQSVVRPDNLFSKSGKRHKKDLERSESNSSSWSDLAGHNSSTEALLEAAAHTPLQSQGTVTKEGEMIAFVAEDLTQKIRMSSPVSKKEMEYASWAGRRTPGSHSVSSISSLASSTSGLSTSSASGWSALSNASGMSRSPSVVTQSPEDIPAIDPRALHDLEVHAKGVAESLEVMMVRISSTMHRMSSMTCGCLDAYQEGIDHTCDSVDASIKSMYALMAKCEELSRNMAPLYAIAEQIKDIKRLLDLFEAQLAKEEKP